MKRMIFLAALLFATPSFALDIEWNRNVEADMKDYHVYACQTAGCTVQPVSSMLVGTVPQPALGVKPTFTVTVPSGTTGNIAVTARDTSNNESGLSNILFFDTIPPENPTGLVKK